MALGDYVFALEMRDVLQQLVAAEIEKQRPQYRYAEVQSFTRSLRKCVVQFTGESSNVTVNMGSIQPQSVGQIVRIDGVAGDRFVADVMGPTYLAGDFDGDSISVSGPTTLNGAVVHNGTTALNGNTTITGTASVSGDMTVTGDRLLLSTATASKMTHLQHYSGLSTDASGFCTITHSAGFTPTAAFNVQRSPGSFSSVLWGIDTITSTGLRTRWFHAGTAGAYASNTIAPFSFLYIN